MLPRGQARADREGARRLRSRSRVPVPLASLASGRRGFAEIGVFDCTSQATTPTDRIGGFKQQVQEQACQAGVDLVIAVPNGIGQYVKGIAFRAPLKSVRPCSCQLKEWASAVAILSFEISAWCALSSGESTGAVDTGRTLGNRNGRRKHRRDSSIRRGVSGDGHLVSERPSQSGMRTARSLAANGAIPSCPWALLPQHESPPSVPIAHGVDAEPPIDPMPQRPRSSPELEHDTVPFLREAHTRLRKVVTDVASLISRLGAFAPQQETRPLFRSAQLKAMPRVTETASSIAWIVCGFEITSLGPSPICPSRFSPQACSIG